MVDFNYQDVLPLGEDKTAYRLLSDAHISVKTFNGIDVLAIEPEALTLLAEQAFKDVSHLFRRSHLKSLANILDDPASSDNDRYVALEMLKNAAIAAQGIFPMCQDTGTAVIMGKKGQQVWTGFCDDLALPLA